MVNPYASEDFNRVKVRQSTEAIEERKKVEVVIPDEQLSLAIGRKGQN